MYQHKEDIKEQIRKRKYKPSPVRRVYIPKDNGDKRGLGIPTVVDRLIQQAISNERLKRKGLIFPIYHYLRVHTTI